MAYTGTLTASGGTAPYSWTVTGLPPGVTPAGTSTATVTVSGTPTTMGTYMTVAAVTDANGHSNSYDVTITIGTATAACAARGNEAALTSATPYAFLVQGNYVDIAGDTDLGVAFAGSFTPNGDGTITAADFDYNAEIADGQQSLVVNLAGSSYSFGSDGRGCLSLAFSGLTPGARPPAAKKRSFHAGVSAPAKHASSRRKRSAKLRAEQLGTTLGNLTLSFALGALDGNHVYHLGRIMEFDNTAGGGTVAAGMMHLQDPTSFALSALHANYAFGTSGWGLGDDFDYRIGIAGTFANSSGAFSSGVADVNLGGEPSGELSGGSGQINGTVSTTTGRATGTYSIPDGANGTLTYDFTIYMVDASDFYYVSSDSVANVPLLSGRALATNASFAAAPLNGYYLFSDTGWDDDNGGNFAEIATLNLTSAGALPSITLYQNDVGSTDTVTYTNASYATESSGRTSVSGGSLNTPPVIYLTSGGDTGESITGFSVGTDLNSSTGVLVSLGTTTAPAYSVANIAGTYAAGSAEDVDGDNGSLVGNFTFSGTGATGTYTNIYDNCSVGSSNTSGATGNGIITVNPDGSGSFDSGAHVLVTNGSQIYAIDFGDEADPLLYVFDQDTLPN
ncbi:MAG: hypothetical protein WA192_16665 [Candidatus Acidiferrales bacterium]